MESGKIRGKLKLRETLRKQGRFREADEIRAELEAQGFIVVDKPDGTTGISRIPDREGSAVKGRGTVVVFGSGEMSSVGRRIHESAIRHLPPPVKIALLETPAGFQDNPHYWYERLKKKLEEGLKNYSPDITLVPAMRKEGEHGTDDPQILAPLLHADYIHTGAGSPSYAVRNLKGSLAMEYIMQRLDAGVPLSVASAVSIAFGRFALPVYELYFAGHDPFWLAGLDFFGKWGLNVSFIPHWDNKEGGKEIDTRFGYMGKKRFRKLLRLLPGPTTLVGIDEHTAVVFNPVSRTVQVAGKGKVTVIRGKDERVYGKRETFRFADLSL